MYYYTYILINRNTNMKYIGKRKSKVSPLEDTQYLGSSKYVPTAECDKFILSTFNTHEEAVLDEIRLHTLYNVKDNPEFYNKSNQTSIKFDTTGLTFALTPEQRQKISTATIGVAKTLTDSQRTLLRARLAQYRTPAIRAKAANSLVINGSNKGTKNSQFQPWYISTETVTYLFTSISKAEKSLLDGFKSAKHYVDIQRKLTSVGKQHRIYGKIVAMGNLPRQYKI